ncbi:MAG: tetratricopeptide repeat protein [Fibrobacterota bacterium]
MTKTATALLVVLLCAALAPAKNLSVAMLDFQYQGENLGKRWYATALPEALLQQLLKNEGVSVMPAPQVRLHRNNLKKGNKPSDIYTFGSLLDLDYFLSGEYQITDTAFTVTLSVWDLRKQRMEALTIEGKEGRFFDLSAKLAEAFLKSAAPGKPFKPAPPPAKSEPLFGIYAKAMDEYAQNRLPEAMFSTRRALDFDKDYAPALLLLARLYSRSGQKAKALAAVKRVYDRNPGDCEVVAEYARFLTLSAKTGAALKLLKENKSLCAGSYFLNSAFGAAYLEEGFFTVAISYLVKAINADPGITEEVFLLGKAYLGSEDYPKAQASFEKAVALEGDNPMYRCMLGIAYRSGGDLIRAVKILEELLVRNPDFLPATFQLAYAYNMLGWQKKALQVLNIALPRNPASSDLLTGLAVTYMKLGEDAQAEAFFKKAMESDPASPTVLNNYGVFMLEKKRDRDAARLLSKALEKDVRNPGIALNLATAYERLGRYEEARKNLELAVESSPGNVDARKKLSNIYRATGQNEKALSILAEVLSLNAQDYESKIEYARLLLVMGRKEEGVNVLEDVVRNNPGNNDYLYLLAESYNSIEWYDIALLKLEKLLEKNPNNARVLRLLGEIYFKKASKDGRINKELGLKCLFYAKNAYTLAPDNPAAVVWYARALYDFKNDPATAYPLFQKALGMDLAPEMRKEVKRYLKGK